jgi:tetratricopeptide (TPR) repeat protein
MRLVTLALTSTLLLASAQEGLRVPVLAPPTRTGAPLTDAERATLREGIAFYEQGKFDEALVKFNAVLTANPDSTFAMYEIALTAIAKKDYQQAIDMAAKGAEYKAEPAALAQYYSLIGNAFDMAKEPKKAVAVYTKGLEIAPAAGLYYNLAVTLVQAMSDTAGAKEALKKGARVDPSHAGTQLMLGKLYIVDDLKTPAVLAFSRFLMLEPATQRTAEGYQLWFRTLNGTLTPNKEGGGATISINPNQKKDEGDLTKLDLFISLSKVSATAGTEGKPQIQQLVDQLDSLFGVWGKQDPGADKDTFLWTYYMPFAAEMQKKNLVEPFVYFVSQRTNLPGVPDWIKANGDRLRAFVEWARSYTFPKI